MKLLTNLMHEFFIYVSTMFTKIKNVLFFSYFIIILLGITLIGATSYYTSSQSVVEKVERANVQIVSQIQNNLDNDFQHKSNILLAPYFNTGIIDRINSYHTMNETDKFIFKQELGDLFLKSFYISTLKDFVRFNIYYRNGELLNSSLNRMRPAESDVQQSDWFSETIVKDGKVHFSGAYADDQEQDKGRELYSASILIRDFSNPKEFIIVQAEYNFKLFQTIGQNMNISENSQLVILDENDKLVYASGETPTSALVSSLAKQTMNKNGTFWNQEAHNEKLLSYTRSDYSEWKIMLLVPRKEIFDASEKIKITTILIAGLAFIITSIISIFFAGRITKPILLLNKSVSSIKRGDFSLRVPLNRKDEIGRIAMNFNAMVDELQDLIDSKYVYQIKLRDAELTMLYSQINPHFLYNTLDSIRAMAVYHNAQEVATMASSLANMFRYNIRNNHEFVPLEEELKQINDYIKIQQIRFGEKIGYELEIDEQLLRFDLLKMTLQPLVENAIFHGLERKKGKGVLKIMAYQSADYVHIVVKDDGVGIAVERLEQIEAKLKKQQGFDGILDKDSTHGIGLSNVYTRYVIRYGAHLNFQIESIQGEGTSVSIKVPNPEKALEIESNE